MASALARTCPASNPAKETEGMRTSFLRSSRYASRWAAKCFRAWSVAMASAPYHRRLAPRPGVHWSTPGAAATGPEAGGPMSGLREAGGLLPGPPVGPDVKKTLAELLLYDSKDLTTHGLCVGMTGSGKTGLCLGILEEAAIDGIPALAIDPKGDLANLALTFPSLAAVGFPALGRPGRRSSAQGLTVEQLAAKTADTWKKGLADWDQSGERISRFRSAAEVAISHAGAARPDGRWPCSAPSLRSVEGGGRRRRGTAGPASRGGLGTASRSRASSPIRCRDASTSSSPSWSSPPGTREATSTSRR